MLQDIAPHVFSCVYQQASPDENSFLVCFRDGQVLVEDTPDGFRFPRWDGAGGAVSCVYLFSIDGAAFFLAVGEVPSVLAHCRPMSLRDFRTARPRHLAFAGVTACQLARWYQSRRFCGGCGQPLQPDSAERMLRCPACGQQEYPQIAPAIIVGVRDGDRLLLTKYADREYKDYALVAGFVEIGETTEDTVRREVWEEVGLRVKNITYCQSQPWAFSSSVLLGFFADLDGSPELRVDGTELASAIWMPRAEIVPPDDSLSLTKTLIRRFALEGGKPSCRADGTAPL